MKKFSISTQLLLLVFTILLFTSFLFISISYLTIHRIAEDQVYKRLESYMIIVRFENPDDDPDNEKPQVFNDMGVSIITKTGNKIEYLDSNYIIPEAEVNEFIDFVLEEDFNDQKGLKMLKGTYRSNEKETVYYICFNSEDTNTTNFIITDDSYIFRFVRNVLLRTFLSFFCIIIIAVTIIYGWSTRVTHRLKLIQNHIIDLPKNKYETSYTDNAMDEIGELSRSVEDMRIEIGTNEKTKQDMLQNLSHDFKTPIAVIKSYAEAYQDGVEGPEALEVILSQADILKKKVNRLLQYNSLEYLSKDKPFENVNMADLIKNVVANYKYQTELTFNLDLEENITFSGYVENWNTVVENIIDNATRYAKSEIKIILRENRLRIYNDGEAIDEQFLNSVFKPYEKGSKGQFGLGMSIVKKTVDFFGMNMKVQNEEYGGVSFIIENRNN